MEPWDTILLQKSFKLCSPFMYRNAFFDVPLRTHLNPQSMTELPYKTKCALPHVIKLTILKWGDFPGFPEWAQCNLTLIRGGQKGQSERRRCDDGSRV